MTPLRTLVISHSAKPTGAPIALLRIMRWCVANAAIEPIFVLREGGTLASDFGALGPTILVSARMERGLRLAMDGVPLGASAMAAVQWLSDNRLRRICRRRRIQAIYANTATQPQMVSALACLGVPVVTHVHELERELRATVGLDGIKRVIAQSDALMAVSGPVRRMLIAHGADDRRIVDVPEPTSNGHPNFETEREIVRRMIFHADDDTIVVAACGLPSWRKGTDVFLQVAQHALADAPRETRISFWWIGGEEPNPALTTLIDDVACLGLGDRVGVIRQRPDADRLLAAADLFICTSREDPNPLVALEAAAAGRPLICFRDAGGAEELADAGGGICVPYLDAKAMADALIKLAELPQERRRLGEKARMIVCEQNTPAVVASRAAAVLQQCTRL